MPRSVPIFHSLFCKIIVHLIIKDGVKISIGAFGLKVASGSSLTIYAQSQSEDTMSKLITTGGSSCSGIGGAFGSYRGNVTINGGMITATGGQNYSGINARVTINEGVVTAIGGQNGAGIIDYVTVNGGVVTATGQNGTGIDANYITINGGVVTATGDQNGSGINGYSIVINRGVVTATAGSSGAKAITYRNNVYIYKGLLVDAGSDAETAATVYDYATNDNYPYVFIRPNPDYTGIYNIAVDSENGTTTVTKDGDPVTSALFGSTITVDVEPASECKFLSLEVVICDENGDVVEPKQNVNVTTVAEGSQYTFVMPEDYVKIVATYVWFDTLVAGHSISLDGDIGINFYTELSDYILNCDTAYMHFTIPTGNGTTTYDVPVSEAKVVKSGDKYYDVFMCPVAAKEMTASVKAQMSDGTVFGTEYSYSVKEYADYLLEHANENAEWEKALPIVKAMLNYGAYSQLYFDKNTGELANANLTEQEKELGDVTIDIDYYPVVNPFDEATFVGATLSLRSETTLSLYFKSSDELTFSGLDIEKETSGDYQIARIRGIKAAQLGDILMLTIQGSNYQYSMRYSPMYYCKNVLADDTQDEKLRNVAKALYLYWKAAESYFGAVDNSIDIGELEGDYEVQNGDVLTGTLVGNKKITVANGATVTLRDVNITSLDNAEYAGITLLGSATIILKGNNIVKGGPMMAIIIYGREYMFPKTTDSKSRAKAL